MFAGAALAFGLAASRAAYGQPLSGFTIGPGIGAEYGVPLTVERAPGVVNRFGVPGTGRSYNITAAAGVRLDFPSLPGLGLRSWARLSLALSTGRFVSDPFTARVIVDSVSGAEELSERDFEVYSTLSALQLDLAAVGFSPFEGLDLIGGVWGSYRLNSGFFEIERVLSPDSIRFEGNAAERTVASGASLGADRLRWGALAAIEFRMPMWPNALLRPGMYVRLDARSLADGVGLRRSLSSGLSLALSLDPAAVSSVDTGDVVPPPPVVLSAGAPLSASIDLYAAAGDSARVDITAVGTFYRVDQPLLPTLLFEPGSDELSASSRVLSAEEAEQFSMTSLARLDPAEISRQRLNVVALRLRESPAAVLKLIGSRSADEPAGLAGRRAAAVRRYLVDAWGISPSRVTMATAPNSTRARDAARSVELDVDRSISAPIVVEWIVNRLRPAPIGMSKRIEGGQGAKRWSVTLRQGESVVGEYSEEDERRGRTIEGAFRLAEGASASLTAELVVQDSLGAVVTVRDELALRRTGAERIERESLSTVIDTAGADSARLRSLLRMLVDRVRDGADITVVSPVDMAATAAASDHRRRVAQTLLEELATTALRIKEVRLVEPSTVGSLTVGSTLPESSGDADRRRLAAGALIVVQQPITPGSEP